MKIKSIAEKSALARTGINSPLYGKHRSEEVRKNISETNRGRIFHYEERFPKCLDCGTLISKVSSRWCRFCYLSNHHPMKNPVIAKKSAKSRSGINHPLFGKHHSKETKKKIGDANRGRVTYYIDGRTTKQYYCKDCSCKIAITTALYNGGRCRICAGKIHSKRMLGRTQPRGCRSPNYRGGKPRCLDCGKRVKTYLAKRCCSCQAKIRKILMSGKNNHMYGKTTHGKYCKYKGVSMHSTWEANFAKWLDLSGIKYKYEPKTFELIINKKETTYTPDFYLPEFDCYIEIKGYWRDDAKIKFETFIEQHKKINIKVLMENHLINMGVIK
jgi:hypothetical protein